MKTVTSAFLIAQLQPDIKFVRVVEFKRRLWNDSTKVFDYESSWTVLPENEILKASPVTWKLDADISNVFKVSNVSLDVLNFDNKWDTENDDGIFGVDAGSPSFKYERYLMKFRIRSGFKFLSGADEIVTIFSGVAVEYVRNSMSRTCQIQLNGLETTLFNTKAEDIANFVVAENIGTGDTSTTEFTTTNPGVGEITKVTLAGVPQVLGDDYTVSDTNNASLSAKVTFASPPGSGVAIAADYYYWTLNQSFKETVEALLTAGGISSGNQLVSDIIFPNDVLNTVVIDSEADFNAGILTEMVTDEHPGLLELNWLASANFTAETWSQSNSGWTITIFGGDSTLSSNGTEFVYNANSAAFRATAFRSSDKIHGYYAFKYKFDTADANQTLQYHLKTVSTSALPSDMRGIIITPSQVTIIGIGGTNFSFSSGTTYHTVEFFFTGNKTRILIDGSPVFDIILSLRCLYVYTTFLGTPNTTMRLKEFFSPKTLGIGEWQSDTIDAGILPSGWGDFTVIEERENYSNAINYYTRTSDNDVSYDAWVLINGVIVGSTLRRYIQIKAEFEFPANHISSNVYGDPHVDRITFKFTTSSTAIVLPEFTGLNVYEAILKLAQFANYEVGYGPDEIFFFRSRATTTSILSLDQSNYISKITGLITGDDKVVGSVRATYGPYVKEITDDGITANGPGARVLERRFEITPDAGIQIPTGADVVTSIAIQFAEYFFFPKRRFRMTTKFLPQLDLSDVVQVSFQYGEPDTVPIMVAVNCKIIGAKYDTTKHFCEFELEEVLP